MARFEWTTFDNSYMAEKSSVGIDELSDIYESWFNGQMKCTECPRRDSDHVTGPLYAYGKAPADVAIVAQAPGGGSVKDDAGAKIGDGKRSWKNYSDSSHSGATPKTRNGFKMQEISTLGNYERDIMIIIDAFDQACQKRHSRPCDIYYTQHTKCNDIREVDGFDPENDVGQDLCANYLIPELKLVQADIVLVMGGKPKGHLQRAMADLGVPQSKTPTRVKDTVFENPEESTDVRTYESDSLDAKIIPSYHYGTQAMRSMKDYTIISNDEKYWEVVAEEAISYLN